MKRTRIVAMVGLAISMLVGGCDTLAEHAGVRDKPAVKADVAALELRLAALEQKLQARESARGTSRLELDVCLDEANDRYWTYVKLNGRRAKSTSDGEIWRAPDSVWEHAEQLKRNAIEECRILHSAR